MGLPSSDANTPGMLMQARRVNSVCVCACFTHICAQCVCVRVYTGACMIPSASWPHTHRGSPSISHFHRWYPRGTGWGHEPGRAAERRAPHLDRCRFTCTHKTSPADDRLGRLISGFQTFYLLVVILLFHHLPPASPCLCLSLQPHSDEPTREVKAVGEVMCCNNVQMHQSYTNTDDICIKLYCIPSELCNTLLYYTNLFYI